MLDSYPSLDSECCNKHKLRSHVAVYTDATGFEGTTSDIEVRYPRYPDSFEKYTDGEKKRKILLISVFSLGIFAITSAVANKYFSFENPFDVMWTYVSFPNRLVTIWKRLTSTTEVVHQRSINRNVRGQYSDVLATGKETVWFEILVRICRRH